eukprot:TRINITY_DN48468_c0_g1_i1.p1 TRINITY_DN48468_c0_g1~~TRINITY_DN48468_c0_g1_i1.p1  ORF type:complete len:381 (+),score=73.95 TRINITY_DN48468_c0_g1_i1:39-1145(+)
MEKADFAKEESKPKLERESRFAAMAQPWAIGVAGAGLLLLGLGAFAVQRSHDRRPLHPFSQSWRSRGSHRVFNSKARPIVAESSDEPADSLDDILDKLENGGSKAKAGRRTSVSTADKTRKASKTGKKAKDQPLAASDELTEQDTEQAKDIIRDSIKKLEAEGKPSAKTRKTLAKLHALLGEDDEVPEDKPSEDENSHMEFAKALRAEQERKVHVELKTVKSEFKKDFGADARSLLCSGCRLVADRLTTELDTHDVHEAEGPAQMLSAKRKAIDSTCSHLRHFQAVVPDGGYARFEASEFTGEGEREGKRLCAALLEEARFDMMARLIQRKIPDRAHAIHSNWERWLCVERTKLCKHSEVKDDEEQEL